MVVALPIKDQAVFRLPINDLIAVQDVLKVEKRLWLVTLCGKARLAIIHPVKTLSVNLP
jgi:hypothetical protein